MISLFESNGRHSTTAEKQNEKKTNKKSKKKKFNGIIWEQTIPNKIHCKTRTWSKKTLQILNTLKPYSETRTFQLEEEEKHPKEHFFSLLNIIDYKNNEIKTTTTKNVPTI